VQTALCCIYLTYAKWTKTQTSRTNFVTVQTVQKAHFIVCPMLCICIRQNIG